MLEEDEMRNLPMCPTCVTAELSIGDQWHADNKLLNGLQGKSGTDKMPWPPDETHVATFGDVMDNHKKNIFFRHKS